MPYVSFPFQVATCCRLLAGPRFFDRHLTISRAQPRCSDKRGDDHPKQYSVANLLKNRVIAWPQVYCPGANLNKG